MTNTDKTVLLPCPFCGCTDISVDDNGHEEWMKCDWCGATGGVDPAPEFEGQSLEWHWNRRASRTQSPAEWQVDAAARAFDPLAFKSWQQSYDYEMGQSGNADEAKSFADWSMGKRIEEVRAAAREALRAASITPPAPERSKEEVGVKVKPLEWTASSKGWLGTKTPWGDFLVCDQSMFGKSWRCFSPDGWPTFSGDSAEEVRLKIDADYEQRIRSALESASLHKGEDDGSEAAAIEIADAVIAWMVKYDLLDADQEYRDDDIVAVLDDLAPAPAPLPVTITDEWPEAPEGWQRTKPIYVRKDGALRVEFVYGREQSPWCVSWSLGNGASASLSYHATPQEALDEALQIKIAGDTTAALSKPGEQG